MFTPAEILNNYTATAKTKTTLVWYKLIILAVLAGAFIAFGAAVSTFAAADFKGSAASLVKGAVFPVGLMLVVVCGAELFTGNCLLVAPAVGKQIRVRSMLKNWGLVYLGNFVGGVLIAVFVVCSRVMPDSTAAACVATAAAKSSLNFGEALLRGILCNMLVCLAVWAAMASKSAAGKILAVYLPVFAFVACGFEHSVADMYYLSAGLMTEAIYEIPSAAISLGGSALCLLAATIGNIIGGSLIALSYFAVYRRANNCVCKNAEADGDTCDSAAEVADAEAAAVKSDADGEKPN